MPCEQAVFRVERGGGGGDRVVFSHVRRVRATRRLPRTLCVRGLRAFRAGSEPQRMEQPQVVLLTGAGRFARAQAVGGGAAERWRWADVEARERERRAAGDAAFALGDLAGSECAGLGCYAVLGSYEERGDGVCEFRGASAVLSEVVAVPTECAAGYVPRMARMLRRAAAKSVRSARVVVVRAGRVEKHALGELFEKM